MAEQQVELDQVFSWSAESPRGMYLYKRVVSRIEEMIVRGELQVGDKLPPERTLSRSFGVSRSSVRQAIQTLAEKGLLSSRRGDGTYVCEPDRSLLVGPFRAAIHVQKDLLRDIMEFRLLLEPQIAVLAARHISPEQMDRLKVLVCDQQRRLLAGEDDKDLDAQFHRTLAEASRNQVILEVYGTIESVLNKSRSEFLQSAARKTGSVAAHLKIIDALEKGDTDEAFHAMRDHLLAVEKTILDIDPQIKSDIGRSGAKAQ